MLTSQTIATVKATAPVIAVHAEAITRRFYTLLFAASPEVQDFFNPAHQHSGGQQRALAGAICAYAANIDNLGALAPAVELIAQKHCSLGVQADHYPIVGKHLLLAIKDILGDAASLEVLNAWNEAYGFLATIFIEREAEIYREQQSSPGGWIGYRKFVVSRMVVESENVKSFYLSPSDGRPLAAFKPGQYITLKIVHPSSTSLRNYSLSDWPAAEYYRISVKREESAAAGPAGIVSNYLHDDVYEGDTLEIGPPCGEFTLDPAQVDGRIVLLSGGIGITPIAAMLKSLVRHCVNEPIYFIHAARNSRVHALGDEIRRLAAEHANLKTHIRYDAPLDDDLRKGRCDSTGFVDQELLGELLQSNDANFYICGPKPFMGGLYRELRDWDVPDSHIHVEFFGPRHELAAARTPA